MIDAGLIKVTDIASKSLIKDPDVKKDIDSILEILEKNLKILSSFEKYKKEVINGLLEWGPVHSSHFWKDNYKKMEEENFALIEKLVKLLF